VLVHVHDDTAVQTRRRRHLGLPAAVLTVGDQWPTLNRSNDGKSGRHEPVWRCHRPVPSHCVIVLMAQRRAAEPSKAADALIGVARGVAGMVASAARPMVKVPSVLTDAVMAVSSVLT